MGFLGVARKYIGAFLAHLLLKGGVLMIDIIINIRPEELSAIFLLLGLHKNK
jgi:hypothetical protein